MNSLKTLEELERYHYITNSPMKLLFKKIADLTRDNNMKQWEIEQLQTDLAKLNWELK